MSALALAQCTCTPPDQTRCLTQNHCCAHSTRVRVLHVRACSRACTPPDRTPRASDHECVFCAFAYGGASALHERVTCEVNQAYLTDRSQSSSAGILLGDGGDSGDGDGGSDVVVVVVVVVQTSFTSRRAGRGTETQVLQVEARCTQHERGSVEDEVYECASTSASTSFASECECALHAFTCARPPPPRSHSRSRPSSLPQSPLNQASVSRVGRASASEASDDGLGPTRARKFGEHTPPVG
jgi:hypothetical protein